MCLLSSKETGCSIDLIKTKGKNQNGLIFDCGDIKTLTLKIKYFLDNKNKISKWKKNSLNIIKKYALNKTINSINKVIK